jgi:hypothetical protein
MLSAPSDCLIQCEHYSFPVKLSARTEQWHAYVSTLTKISAEIAARTLQ